MRGRCLVVGAEPLHPVLRDLIAGLEARGWSIDASTLEPPAASFLTPHLDSMTASAHAVVRDTARVLRRAEREVVWSHAASVWFDALEARLASGRDDVVLACVDVAPVGLARLVARAHPRAALLSLNALRQELLWRRSLPWLRAVACAVPGRPLHADSLRAIEPARVPTTLFASGAWRDGAVAAGVPASNATVIPLGVPIPARAVARHASLPVPARLLWAGRLSPEKGLHLFLEALPRVRASHPVTLTVIAGSGPEGYATEIAQAVARLDLGGVVEFRPAVSRDELLAAFAQHDILLFHSVFAEPVAQILLHAAAAGLPVVGPAAASPGSILRDGSTAWCYDAPTPTRVADAVVRALTAGPEREARAQALAHAVREAHDLAQTVERYDAVLSALLDGASRRV